jgi:hypothetical protein
MKGNTKMLHTNSIFYTREFNAYIKELIETGATSYYDLQQDEKEQLAAYYIAQNIKERSEFLYQSKNFDHMIGLLLNYMIKADVDDKEILVDEMKSAAVKYYESELALLFDDKYTDMEFNKNYEKGLTKQIHPDNGETYWVQR